VKQAIKGGLLTSARSLFQTPLQKSKEMKSMVQAQCAELIAEMEMTANAISNSAHLPDPSDTTRPSSATVSAVAFG